MSVWLQRRLQFFSQAEMNRESMPRKEIIAVDMGARLLKECLDSTTLPIERHKLWSDSQTVIKWCTNQDLELRVFERNRVDLIMRNTQGKAPRYVPSGSNPADVATRPCKVSQSDRWNLWTRGPDFLRMPMSNWYEVKTEEVCASIQRIASNPCTSLNDKNTNAGFLQYTLKRTNFLKKPWELSVL